MLIMALFTFPDFKTDFPHCHLASEEFGLRGQTVYISLLFTQVSIILTSERIKALDLLLKLQILSTHK